MKLSGIDCYIKIWKWLIFERSRPKVKVEVKQKVKFYLFLPAFISLFVCEQHNSKSYGSILMKLSGIDCYIKIWKWLIFERSRSKIKVEVKQKVKFT